MKIQYRVSFPHPTSHLVHVRMEVTEIPDDVIDLVLPSWVPGSYKIRDFARHIESFRAGRLKWEKTEKHRWRVALAGARSATIEYDVFCFELSVQTSHHDATHAFLNLGNVLFYVEGEKGSPCGVEFTTPPGWGIATGLEPVRGSKNRFTASDYDVLIDCPVEIGTFREHRFRVRGIPHRLVIHGEGNFDERRMVADLQKICAAEIKMMRGIPYRHYTFILHPTAERGGGLEHLNSTALQMPRFSFQPSEIYQDFLGLVAHEFFHLWNVKRIRPEMLGPFDYEKEVYTTLLWVMEGITSYYDEVFPVRAKVTPAERYFKRLGKRIQGFEEKPGRRKQSLSESSFDTWIKLYQPNENAVNSMMSYYEKGELVGLLLDMEIRGLTKNRASLDDVMRRLYRDHAQRGVGFPEEEFQKTVERVAGRSFAGFFKRYVHGTQEIDWNNFLSRAGLKLVKEPKKPESGEAARAVLPWLGVLTQRKEGRVTVTSVIEKGPAWRDGLSAGDELLAIDGFRIDPEKWEKRIQERKPGDRVVLTVSRDGLLCPVSVRLSGQPNIEYKVRLIEKPSAAQRTVFKSWLETPWKAPKKLSRD